MDIILGAVAFFAMIGAHLFAVAALHDVRNDGHCLDPRHATDDATPAAPEALAAQAAAESLGPAAG